MGSSTLKNPYAPPNLPIEQLSKLKTSYKDVREIISSLSPAELNAN
jgi:hypothetical protein